MKQNEIYINLIIKLINNNKKTMETTIIME